MKKNTRSAQSKDMDRAANVIKQINSYAWLRCIEFGHVWVLNPHVRHAQCAVCGAKG